MSRVESSISSEQAPGVDNAHNLRKVCYFHSYRPTHWSGFGKLEKLACLKMMKRGRRAYTDPFLKQHWSQQELSSIHPALFWKIFIIYKSQIFWSEMFTSCKPCHQVYQGTVQCFSALTNREKVLFFPIKALALLVYFKVNKCVCDSQPHTVDTCEIVCVIPNLCILRFVSLLRRLAQSHTDFSCNINFKSNSSNSEREIVLITKIQKDWN